MSTDRRNTDWADVWKVSAILILIVLFAGDPDLMDAIIARIGGHQ